MICKWVIDEYHYETECNNAFEFYIGGPLENKYIYCPYCGKEIEEIK